MSEKKQPRPRRTYTTEFKQQLVNLYRSGKRKCDIVRKYDIVNSLLDKWIAQTDHSGSFNEKDNRTPEQQELIELRKQNQQLKMENDILNNVSEVLTTMKQNRKRSNLIWQTNGEFDEQPHQNVVVSDLTYVRVGMKLHMYTCGSL